MANQGPSFNVYTVEDRGKDQDPFWLKIGAAFPHQDGKGYNIVLSAFPIDNRLVLRTPAEPQAENGNGKEAEAEPEPKSRRKR